MKTPTLSWAALLLLVCTSCNKTVDALIEKAIVAKSTTGKMVQYQIRQGQHSSDHEIYKTVNTGELKFTVRFDSSAIYTSQATVNQFDINKLYGFSDNNADHHQYSARFGWSWTGNALRLYAYVYNAGTVLKQELGTVAIGAETYCSIKVSGNNYVFTINDLSVAIPRSSTTETAKGYMLYPYFGGDEVAPHDIFIRITNL